MGALESYFNVSGAYLRGEKPLKIDLQIDNDNLRYQPANPDGLKNVCATLSDAILNNFTGDVANLAAKDAFDAMQRNCKTMIQAFASLSPSGQSEMLKRITEYLIVEAAQEENKSLSSHTENDDKSKSGSAEDYKSSSGIA